MEMGFIKIWHRCLFFPFLPCIKGIGSHIPMPFPSIGIRIVIQHFPILQTAIGKIFFIFNAISVYSAFGVKQIFRVSNQWHHCHLVILLFFPITHKKCFRNDIADLICGRIIAHRPHNNRFIYREIRHIIFRRR